MCQDWDPDAYIFYNRATRTFEIDESLVNELKVAPFLVPACDGSMVLAASGGHFELVEAGPDDLARHLGFSVGDVIQSVNGQTLLLPDDLFDAMSAQWDATSFVVKVKRAGAIITLRYEIV